ncbi:hypothetical protein [Phyllobacterium phragmitis]|uniref:hypothetical protein n=1 Tax=Phyllobacterium phragmitis TaxID=2670329 RepID=UPI001304E6D4|nr:hypothetical protein [Phyllobacterium phragmitis]
MVQLHIADTSNRSAHARHLEEQFPIHHEIHTGAHGWRLARPAGRAIETAGD